MIEPEGRAGGIESGVLLKAVGLTTLPKKLAEGSRRALRVPLSDASAGTDQDGVPYVSFALPRGSFATAVLAAFGWSDREATEQGDA
jgi:tRNA(Glu) U13 pseudouridine synthase TruD